MVKKTDDMLIRFYLIPERHGRTDRQTDGRTEILYQYRASECWSPIKTETSLTISEDPVLNIWNKIRLGGNPSDLSCEELNVTYSNEW